MSLHDLKSIEEHLGHTVCFYSALRGRLPLSQAIVLSQLIRWMGHAPAQSDGWVSASQGEWERTTGLVGGTGRRARIELANRGLIQRRRPANNAPNFYRVDLGELAELLANPSRDLDARGGQDARSGRADWAREVVNPVRGFKGSNTKPKTLGGDDKRPQRGSQLPDSWQPSDELVAWAKSEFPSVDVGLETDAFRDHALSKGRVVRNWNAAWRNWIRKAAQFQAQRSSNGSSYEETPSKRYRPAKEVLAEERAAGR